MTIENNKKTGLLLYPSTQWKGYGMEFRFLHPSGDAFRQGDFVTDGGDDAAINRLITLCEAVTPESIYNMAGRNTFRTQKKFFAEADASIRNYVDRIVARKVVEAVTLAAANAIPIFFKPGPKELLDANRQLHYVDEPVALHTFYRKTGDGIDYRLTVGHGIVPSSHRTAVISNEPSLFCIDDKIMHFDASLNGNLLLPFIKKEWIKIPQRVEMEYFRKMIFKIASKIDIDSEGFDVRELHPAGKARLFMEMVVTGDYHLRLSFVYDGKNFEAGSKKEKSVTLLDGGDSVSFVCIHRNREWEEAIAHRLTDDMHMPKNAPLQGILDWAKHYKPALDAMGIEFEQLTSKKYYIGDVRVEHDDTVVGDWFQLHIVVHFDDGLSVPLTSMRQAILNGDSLYLLPNGKSFVIPDEWKARYSPLMLFGLKKDADTISVHRSQQQLLMPLSIGDEAKAAWRADDTADDSLPTGLAATLRPYQEVGYRWMLGHLRAGNGCCLSDDMGLGKTVQTIAVILKYRAEAGAAARPVLVVAPASVVHNWRNELHRFAPHQRVIVYTGTTVHRQLLLTYADGAAVLVTTYATLRNDISMIGQKEWGIVVYDESQVFKNSDSMTYDAVASIRCRHRIALSGTPMENNLRELWTLMSVLNPALLGDESDFRSNFIHPINANLAGKNTAVLRDLVAPYFLRRTKAAVLDSLPECQDETVYCDMTPAQTSLYVAEQSRMRNLLLEHDAHSNTINALSTIMKLRQIACAPALVGSEAPSGKMAEIMERLTDLRGTSHKVLIFSEFKQLLNIVAKAMDDRGWSYAMLTGETRDREGVIDHFQNDASCQFFLITLKAGGVGLNLTEADYVFLLDPWWNHAVEEQAISRAHRQGQRRAVFVYKFISVGTLEEQILKVQDHKQSLANAVIKCMNESNEEADDTDEETPEDGKG